MGIDYSNATTKQLLELAEQGDVMAQKFLAYRYDIGQGVKKDYEKAAYWYEKAAEQGDAVAQCNLGWCYDEGKGVIQNYEKARSLYQKAVCFFAKSAEEGDARAQNSLGVCYAHGRGVEQDYEKAVYWYTKAAEQGNRIAQKNLDIVSKQIEVEKGLKRCAHCGGTFKGIFKKVCSVCGKEKDY